MHLTTRTPSVYLSCCAALFAAATLARAGTLWNESVNGDLSNNQLNPTSLTLVPGTNAVIGTVGGLDTQDWVAVDVPDDYQLSALILRNYVSTDSQGFIGFQFGAGFAGNVYVPTSYAGYAHFGTGATNGALPPTDLTGADLLPLMADPTLSAGATGFTIPLDSGPYTFLIQQLSNSTQYEFDYIVTPVPAPSSLALLTLSAAPCLCRSRRRAGV